MSIAERWALFAGTITMVGLAVAWLLAELKLRAQRRLYGIEHELRESIQQRAVDLAKTLQSVEYMHAQQVLKLEAATRFLRGELAAREKVLIEISTKDPRVLAGHFNSLGRVGDGMPDKANGARAGSGYGEQALLDGSPTDPRAIPGGDHTGRK